MRSKHSETYPKWIIRFIRDLLAHTNSKLIGNRTQHEGETPTSYKRIFQYIFKFH